MPSNPIKMKDELDRFYTKDLVAKQCIDTLLRYCQDSDLFVEPSAGGGAFFRQLPNNKVGLDLAPSCDGVVKGDWFDYEPPCGCVVVGNPPFGTRNSLTKAFIKHSLDKAKIIAFVLPSSYRKETTQAVFPVEWNLVESIDLPHNSFTFEGDDYHVPCVFQIWIKNYLTDLRESSKVKITTEDFEFVGKIDADWFTFGASPSKTLDKEEVTSKNRGYYIKEKIEGVRTVFSLIDWKKKANSSVSGGVAWYSKQEIINIYEEFKNEKH